MIDFRIEYSTMLYVLQNYGYVLLCKCLNARIRKSQHQCLNSFEGANHVFSIISLSVFFHGQYFTKGNQVHNPLKVITICFILADRPDPPRYPTCENIRDESVLLSWKPPLNDGGSFITQYVIEKCEPPNSNWIRVAVSRYGFVGV